MSVYESQRSESEIGFYHRAVEIRAKVTKLVRSEKVVPKSSRFIFAVPMAETARSMVCNIVTGMEFFPNSEENVAQRKRYYTLAIADCRMLQEDMKCLIEVTGNVRPSAFGEVTAMMTKSGNLRQRGRTSASDRLQCRDVAPCLSCQLVASLRERGIVR